MKTIIDRNANHRIPSLYGCLDDPSQIVRRVTTATILIVSAD